MRLRLDVSHNSWHRSRSPEACCQFDRCVRRSLAQITDPKGNITPLTYTPVGLINTIKDAKNNVTT
jgi:hypothetical protein